MRTFTDNAGRTWTITINVAAIKRVRGLMNVDLYQCIDDGFESLANMIKDPVRLADVLYCLCKDEAEAKSITDEDFGRSLAGDAITHAADAFVEELIDFFPDARMRTSLRKAIEKGRIMREKLLERAECLLEAIDLDSEAKKLIDSFGASRASSESIPDPLHSANSP